jgi:CubicO group peptidase (beta-lactamase class C family)
MQLQGERRLAVAMVVAALALVCASCTSSDDAADSNREADARATETTASSEETADGRPVPGTLDFGSVDEQIDAYVAEHELNGAAMVVVDRDLGVVHEHYAGDFGPDRPSLIASSSKMLTAGVLMRLHDQGVLDVDEPIAEVVDWGDANPDITPAQLVSNSSGLVGLLQDPTYRPYLCQYLAAGTLGECGERIFTTSEDDDLVIPPDTEFRYGGGQWQVAGAVAEAASGDSWAELIEQTYVEPCGVDSLAYNNHFTQIVGDDGPFGYPEQFDGDPSVLADTDNPNMEGGAYIDPPDYAQLLLMHLRGGECDGGRVLSEESVERMQTDRVVSTYDAALGRGSGTEAVGDYGGYGLGWWIGADDEDYVEDGGAFGAVPWIDRDRGYGVYLVLESSNRLGRELAKQLRPDIEAQMDRLD